MIVRKRAHALGLRFRLHRKDLPGTPDLAFPKYRVAMFVHGCFWHGHTGCSRGAAPSSNADFWAAKLSRNKARDQAAVDLLTTLGWQPLIIWECEVKSGQLLDAKLASVRRSL
jgi:DNA mismatch endonuclease (patch repair protein)